jgi:hypothetical protein
MRHDDTRRNIIHGLAHEFAALQRFALPRIRRHPVPRHDHVPKERRHDGSGKLNAREGSVYEHPPVRSDRILQLGRHVARDRVDGAVRAGAVGNGHDLRRQIVIVGTGTNHVIFHRITAVRLQFRDLIAPSDGRNNVEAAVVGDLHHLFAERTATGRLQNITSFRWIECVEHANDRHGIHVQLCGTFVRDGIGNQNTTR